VTVARKAKTAAKSKKAKKTSKAKKTKKVKKTKKAKKARKTKSVTKKTMKAKKTKKTTTSASGHTPNSDALVSALKPPPGGAAVRMYRIGHGDCFLIAFEGQTPEKPAYVLIDCGYKPGSPGKLVQPTKVKEIGANIIATTGGFVDVGVVTHEHQDHVNGLTSGNFPGLKVGKVWFAWTENPDDDIANQLRKKFKDRLLGLIDTRSNLLGLGKTDAVDGLDWFLEFELGETADSFNGLRHLAAAGKDPAGSANKIAMKFLRDCATGDPDYLYPHQKVIPVPGAKSARVFALGPPHDIDKIDDLDPVGDETFGDDDALGMAAGGGASLAKASPFSRHHAIPLDQALTDQAFFGSYYGGDNIPAAEADDGKEIPLNASWRRMTADDTADAGALALAMNNATNNASLVLAFELSKGGKVLLFVGDAQAGNWRSWADDKFDDGGTEITVEDLLGRTVLYKVGHHGSHNATLKGKAGGGGATLASMAKGAHGTEFVAMITAVEAWAHQKPKPDWNHPLPAIKQALVEKAGGRVLQTDCSLPPKPTGAGAAGWQAFSNRVTETPLYFDLTIDP
jgi:beta-lactamase superfamily II metal-dependent hydrolase